MKYFVIPALLVSALALTACGKKEEQAQDTAAAEHAAPAAEHAAPAAEHAAPAAEHAAPAAEHTAPAAEPAHEAPAEEAPKQ